MKRTLTLKRESLASLTTREMAAFGGAAAGPLDVQSMPLRDCVGTLQNTKVICTGTTCSC